MVKFLVNLSAALGLFVATVAATPVAQADVEAGVDAAPGPPAESPIHDLVLYPPGYNKTEAALEARGYAGTCRGCDLVDIDRRATLYCRCDNIRGESKEAWYDLNNCIGNGGGRIAWWRNGGFMGSCFARTLKGAWMDALCDDGRGTRVWSGLNLDEHLQNWDGAIGCDY
ncbi:hypothetical protein CMUS01_14053 [Colletotrichum musicola]|uniref:Cyanovirin-N domain-containing protein n=3 Tax=Colletotrichum orchidearum species complex TaxID=2707337 RepID=A0A8H6MTJ0_9PEZI|nr:hypothetical protein CSOJ01_13759 [Colletotrichum sojae]KAF6807738.1 hypothetical protein CMUS01_14053 [Colletotrichum musicola]KAF6808382.1 hypothetical protein CPLU01_15684 [Colletotrichum plurivorum]